MIGNAKTAARLLGLPYLPITPTFPLLGPLGLVPLPSKWLIAFGEPIETASYGPAAAEDPMLVFNLTDQVRETIQHSLYQLLLQREERLRLERGLRLPAGNFGRALVAQARARRRPGAAGRGRRQRRRATVGTPILAALRPVRKSRIVQPRARATARSSVSGLTATAVPARESIGRSLAESL